MKRQFLIIFMVVISSMMLLASEGLSVCLKFDANKSNFEKPKEKYVPGEILVKFKKGVSQTKINAFNSRLGTSILSRIPQISAYQMKVPQGIKVSEMIQKYRTNPDVEYAEPNYKREVFVVPNDTYYSAQWALTRIEAEKAWEVKIRGKEVIVAVVDTGVDSNHPDLKNQMVSGYNFVDNNNNANDDYGHGTHCAGIIAAQSNNGTGISGLSWKAKIMPLKVNVGGFCIDSATIPGIIYAAEGGASVISLSFGSEDSSYFIEEAVNYAYDKGCVVVAAAGNEDTYLPSYPAAYDNVISVAATNKNDEKSSYSNYGSSIEISAPGGDFPRDPGGIYSTMPTYHVTANNYGYSKNYDYMCGTSMACPYVAGLAGFFLSHCPNLSVEEVREIIRNSADDLGSTGWDQYYGYGRINAYEGIKSVPIVYVPTIENVTNFPNPFRLAKYEKITISFPQDLEELTIKIYNIAGETVRELKEGNEIYLDKGEAYWDGRNEDGDKVASGLYIYLLKSAEGIGRGKITLIK